MITSHTVQLADEDRQLVLNLAERIHRYDVVTETEQHVRTAQLLCNELPESVRSAARDFKRYGNGRGGLLLRGVPTGPVPATPAHADLAVGSTLRAAAVLALFAALLGDQYGFMPELSGRLTQDILPVQGFEDTQQSISSTTDLYPHVESAFTDNRADFIGLFCLRQYHDRVAGTTLSPIEEVLKHLDAATISVLRQPRFKTAVDASFLRGSGCMEAIFIGPIRIFSGSTVRPRVRCDFAETSGIDPVAQKAVEALRQAAVAASSTIALQEGDLLFVDNHYSFHGRTSFRPRWDGNDRWLMRTFVTRDLARTSGDRPHDGRIVDTDYAKAQDVMPV